MNADLANTGVDIPASELAKTWLAAAVGHEMRAAICGSCAASSAQFRHRPHSVSWPFAEGSQFRHSVTVQ